MQVDRSPIFIDKQPAARIGLGLAALGRPGYINLGHADDLDETYDVTSMQARAHTLLDAAYQAGVRYFDAARSYGKAELFLGRWLRSRRIPVGEIVVGSKWGYTYTADWQVGAEVHEVKEHSPAVFAKQQQESLANLGPYLKLYQVHSATLESGVLENNAVLCELGRLQQEEGIAIGLTVSGPGQADVILKALDVEVEGKRLFDSVQVTWNLLEGSTSSALVKAKSAGLGIIVKEALANGRLTARNDHAAFTSKMDLLKGEARRLGVPIDALVIAAVLAQPWADVVLSGAARLDHLHSNLLALAVKWDEQAGETLAALQESAEDYWTTRSQLRWN